MREISESNYKSELGEDEGDTTSDTSTSTPTSTGKKWSSGRTFGKTYMNNPSYKWESGRTMGKTYQGPGYVWDSGVSRGHANPVESVTPKKKIFESSNLFGDGKQNIDDAKTIQTVFGELKVPDGTTTHVIKTDFSKPWGNNNREFLGTDSLGPYINYVLYDKKTQEPWPIDSSTYPAYTKWVMTNPLDVDPNQRQKVLYYPEPGYLSVKLNDGRINAFEIQGVRFTWFIKYPFDEMNKKITKQNWRASQLSFFNPTMLNLRGWDMTDGFYYLGADEVLYPYKQDDFFEESWWKKWGSVVIIVVGAIVSVIAGFFFGPVWPIILMTITNFLSGLYDIFVADNTIGGAIGIIMTLVGMGTLKYIKVSNHLWVEVKNAFKGVKTEAQALAAYEGLSVTEKQIFRKVFEQEPYRLQKDLEQVLSDGILDSAKKMGAKKFIKTIKTAVKNKELVWEKIPVWQRTSIQRAITELGIGASLLSVGWEPMMDEKNKKEKERQKRQLQFAQTRLANMSPEELAKYLGEKTPEQLNAFVGGNINSAKSEVSKIANQVTENPDTNKMITIDMGNKDQDMADVLSGFDFN
jgi:hypothetical protein